MYPEGLSPSGIFFRKVTCRKRKWICYVPASIAFWGQEAVCWDNPKPLKVSGIFLTSLCLSDQRRCLLVHNRSISFSANNLPKKCPGGGQPLRVHKRTQPKQDGTISKADITTLRLAASSPQTSISPPVRECWGIMRMRIVGITRLSDLIVQETSRIPFSTLYHYA